MTKLASVDHLSDYDLLIWILEQEFPWRTELNNLSNANTLQELVDYVRNNYKQIKQLGNEKERTRRKA